MISSRNLADAIYKISKDTSLDEKDVVQNILSYVREHKLEDIFEKAISHLEKKTQKDKVWNTLHIKSGLGLDEVLISDISQKLNAKENMGVMKEIDSDLIGGFVATYKGVIYDASLKNQLKLLRQVLTK